jgi:hypothetical protein
MAEYPTRTRVPTPEQASSDRPVPSPAFGGDGLDLVVEGERSSTPPIPDPGGNAVLHVVTPSEPPQSYPAVARALLAFLIDTSATDHRRNDSEDNS